MEMASTESRPANHLRYSKFVGSEETKRLGKL
jgi:hypothetical protein